MKSYPIMLQIEARVTAALCMVPQREELANVVYNLGIEEISCI